MYEDQLYQLAGLGFGDEYMLIAKELLIKLNGNVQQTSEQLNSIKLIQEKEKLNQEEKKKRHFRTKKKKLIIIVLILMYNNQRNNMSQIN